MAVGRDYDYYTKGQKGNKIYKEEEGTYFYYSLYYILLYRKSGNTKRKG